MQSTVPSVQEFYSAHFQAVLPVTEDKEKDIKIFRQKRCSVCVTKRGWEERKGVVVDKVKKS